MPYLWIFLCCYSIAFIIINIKMAVQKANMEARIKMMGGSVENLRSNIRAEMPLLNEILIRIWAPFVFSILPAVLLSIAYFAFS